LRWDYMVGCAFAPYSHVVWRSCAPLALATRRAMPLDLPLLHGRQVCSVSRRRRPQAHTLAMADVSVQVSGCCKREACDRQRFLRNWHRQQYLSTCVHNCVLPDRLLVSRGWSFSWRDARSWRSWPHFRRPIRPTLPRASRAGCSASVHELARIHTQHHSLSVSLSLTHTHTHTHTRTRTCTHAQYYAYLCPRCLSLSLTHTHTICSMST